MKKAVVAALVATSLFVSGATFSSYASAADNATTAASSVNSQIPESLIKAAQAEGKVWSLGMPDAWANWKETWEDLEKLYGIKHVDTDMSSAQEIAKFDAEKKNASGDIGDIGQAFAELAVKKGVTIPYKVQTWDSIPDWAKDKDGHWALAYTGTIAIMTNNQLVKNPPKSWKDMLEGDYKVTVGDVGIAAQANSAVLAAAYALGGDEKNLNPAIDFFAKLAEQGRLLFTDPSLAYLEKGEVEVALLWDFNALNYRDQIDPKKFTVVIPSDGSITSGYTTIINKYSQHPNAAKLAREYIFSDKGQINLARGYAKPIRSDVVLPDDVKAKLLPPEQYKNAHPIKDYAAWEKSSQRLPRMWQEKVLIHQD